MFFDATFVSNKFYFTYSYIVSLPQVCTSRAGIATMCCGHGNYVWRKAGCGSKGSSRSTWCWGCIRREGIRKLRAPEGTCDDMQDQSGGQVYETMATGSNYFIFYLTFCWVSSVFRFRLLVCLLIMYSIYIYYMINIYITYTTKYIYIFCHSYKSYICGLSCVEVGMHHMCGRCATGTQSIEAIHEADW